MSKKRILALISPSGSGKSTLESFLEKMGMHRVISNTTRKPRNNEETNKAYYFVTQDNFNKLDLLERVVFNGNSYGASIDEFTDNSVFVCDRHGLEQLIKRDEFKVVSVYVQTNVFIRAYRMFKRGDSIKAIWSRLINDYKAFKGVKDMCDHVISNNGDAYKAKNKLNKIRLDMIK